MAIDLRNYEPALKYGATTNITTAQVITDTSNQSFAVGANGATNPVFNVDNSTASVATGLNVKGAAAASGLAISVITSGTNENLTIDAAGSGTITLGTTSTGVTTSPRNIQTTGTGAHLATGTGGIGYGTGAGGTVTQLTNRSTGVTLSKMSGTITTDTTSLAAGASAEFTVTNTLVAIGDVIVVSQRSGSAVAAGVAGTTIVEVVGVAAGSFILSVNNNSSTTAETGAIIINFAVIKAVTA